MRIVQVSIWFIFLLTVSHITAFGQEILATVTVNHDQVQGTDETVFKELQQKISQFLNERQWTSLAFNQQERINCNIHIAVSKYDKSTNSFTTKATIQAVRPVFNSTYSTTIFNHIDQDFNFEFSTFDQLTFTEESVNNQLTALLAYYSLFMIGLNQDTFSLFGGEEILQRCFILVNNAQTLNYTGWKSFSDIHNRFALINDYLNEGLKPFRQLQYAYYRSGLDEMYNNVARGRSAVTKSISNLLLQAHKNAPLSILPQMWTDYKRDELVGIYSGTNNTKEKQDIYDMLFSINASQAPSWQKILQ